MPESDVELLARLTTEIILEEIARRAVTAGMSADEFIAATRESIRKGREENEAGRRLGHENDPLA